MQYQKAKIITLISGLNLLIRLDNITLIYQGKNIFNNLSLDVADCEKVCINGASGRGKTTFLKMLSGLVLPDSGTVFINGLEINPVNIKTIRNLITWVPQNINMPVSNANDLISLLGLMSNIEKISKYLEKLGLSSVFLGKEFNEISGGEKQRIVIAVCLSIDKPILLLDEPTSALDDDAIEELASLISNFKDKTIISASHNHQWLDNSKRVISL